MREGGTVASGRLGTSTNHVSRQPAADEGRGACPIWTLERGSSSPIAFATWGRKIGPQQCRTGILEQTTSRNGYCAKPITRSMIRQLSQQKRSICTVVSRRELWGAMLPILRPTGTSLHPVSIWYIPLGYTTRWYACMEALAQTGEVLLKGCRCRCGHEWLPRNRSERPRVCPRCKSPNWDRPPRAKLDKDR